MICNTVRNAKNPHPADSENTTIPHFKFKIIEIPQKQLSNTVVPQTPVSPSSKHLFWLNEATVETSLTGTSIQRRLTFVPVEVRHTFTLILNSLQRQRPLKRVPTAKIGSLKDPSKSPPFSLTSKLLI